MAIIQNLEAFVQSYPAGLDSVTDLQLSQNENGRQIRFTIGGVTIPAGSVATISGTKPDGVVYSNTGTIEGADTVIFDEDVQMTAVFGTWYAKIRITNAGNTIASARVRFIIDKDPVDAGAIPSESQLDGLVAEAEEYAEAAEDAAERAAITYGSPLTASTASAMTDINRVYVYTGSESGYTYGDWYYYNGSAWTSGGIYNSAAVETDTTLTESGVPADAKATGDEIAELKDDLEQIVPGLTDEAKNALLACFAHVAWIDEQGQDYYDALETALDTNVIKNVAIILNHGYYVGDGQVRINAAENTKRAYIASTQGEHKLRYYNNGVSGDESPYYPIQIPIGAKYIWYDNAISTLYTFTTNIMKWDASNNIWQIIQQGNFYWAEGPSGSYEENTIYTPTDPRVLKMDVSNYNDGTYYFGSAFAKSNGKLIYKTSGNLPFGNWLASINTGANVDSTLQSLIVRFSF